MSALFLDDDDDDNDGSGRTRRQHLSSKTGSRVTSLVSSTIDAKSCMMSHTVEGRICALAIAKNNVLIVSMGIYVYMYSSGHIYDESAQQHRTGYRMSPQPLPYASPSPMHYE